MLGLHERLIRILKEHGMHSIERWNTSLQDIGTVEGYGSTSSGSSYALRTGYTHKEILVWEEYTNILVDRTPLSEPAPKTLRIPASHMNRLRKIRSNKI